MNRALNLPDKADSPHSKKLIVEYTQTEVCDERKSALWIIKFLEKTSQKSGIQENKGLWAHEVRFS